MPHIRPTTDLKNTNEISELCHTLEEPIFLTKNGYGDLVIMSIKTYEQQMAMAYLYRQLADAEKEIADGKPTIPAEVVIKKLSEQIGKVVNIK